MIGKTFDLVTVHSRVGARVLEMYDRDHIPAGGAVVDVRVMKAGFLVYRDSAVPPPLTISLACNASYQTRSSGRKGFVLLCSPEHHEDSSPRWLRIPGEGGTYTFILNELTHKLAEVALEGVAFPIDDVPPPAPSYR
ncbi:hypothetical protein [Streptomyces sp. SID3343]|uniref:hypothetical protein n=1 Tax=Streptomyces sp. SID3343 TaxID=2690260 RepID=UPI0013721138|nr:hypothetical protein [Streptomyces sp. SID3343]